MPRQFTTVHDRYQISDSCCGMVETATSLKKASELAKNHADRHAVDHDNTTTVVIVFDVMARRDSGGGAAPKMPLPDFFIGAQAEVMDWKVATRDQARFEKYFPGIALVTP